MTPLTQNQGHLYICSRMNRRYKENFLRAGALAKEVRAYGRSLIRPGSSYQEVIREIRRKTLELGGIPAFPPQIALNDVAAHYLPKADEDILFSDQMVKLDIGVCYNGAIGDCATTVDLSGKHGKLIEAAEAALLAAEKKVMVGLSLKHLGQTIEETIKSYGFQSIRNLSGHGLGPYKIHTSPVIPNYASETSEKLRAGMTFAIEPFATDGVGMIYEEGVPRIFSLVANRPVRSEFARKLLLKIRDLQGLPFAIQDLMTTESELSAVEKGLEELVQAGVLFGHAPLIEQRRGLVAQAENSVLIDEKGDVFITTR